MEKPINDLSSIYHVALQLRVPELKYRIDNGVEQDALIDRFFTANRLKPEALVKQPVTRKVLADFNNTPLPRKFNNLAFMTDRFFDTWLRKNNLAPDINEVIGKWRFLFFELLYRQQNEAGSQAFIQLLEALAIDNFGWCAFPKRSSHILISMLHKIEVELFSADVIDDVFLLNLRQQWQQFELKQRQTFIKVTERLIDVERRGAVTRYAKALAQDYLNQTFFKHMIPDSLKVFLENYWLEFLSRVFQDIPSAVSSGSFPDASSGHSLERPTDNAAEQAKALTYKILVVFCGKGKGAFQHGDSLIDDLLASIKAEDGPKVPNAIWANLENDIVHILQNKPVIEKLYHELSCHESVSEFETVSDNVIDNRLWFSTRVEGCERRVQIARVFDDCKQLLLCNYAGMKFNVLSFAEFEQGCRRGDYKVLSSDVSFSKVIETSSAGLLKVAITQRQARIKAAEKAKKEAEQLLAEKHKSEQDAHLKASDIAERTRNIQLKRVEKQRLQKEQEVYQALSEFKLGAWIGIIGGSEDERVHGDENAVQRYKLAVKLAATGKYIFVDKLGIKKRQYTEASLVAGIVRGEIEILSHGAEFEDSLERVLSRMRMSK